MRELRKEALNRWQVDVKSGTKDDVKARFSNLCKAYDKQPLFVKYLKEEQLPHVKMCIKYWTSKVQYFGNATTCRLEGGHHTLKSFLANSQGDLLDVIERIKLYIDRETRELRSNLLKLAHSQYQIATSNQYRDRWNRH